MELEKNNYDKKLEEMMAEINQGKKKEKRTKIKGLISMIAAGVTGSFITLYAAPYTDIIKDQYSRMEQKVETLSEKIGQEEKETTDTTSVTVQQTSTKATNSIADMVENASKSIVGIVNIQQQQNNYFSQSSEGTESGSGSGVIFKKNNNDAYIITNNHVIEGASAIEVSLYDGQKTEAELIGADALTDLAVIKIAAKYVTNVIDFGDSENLRAGDQVWAIGNPLGMDLSRTVTQGIVSAVDRTISVTTSAGDWDLDVIQTDAAINPGNSGGALINSSGQVIGINSLKISDSGVEGLGFAIPSNDLIPIVNEMIENGKIERPYIGIGLASLEEIPQMYLQNLAEDVTAGVMITNIDPNSAAADAGLQVQDVIVSINGQKVETANDLRKYLYTEMQVGDKAKFDVYQDGKMKTIELTLTSDSSAASEQ